jgi:hypothetical protein
MINLSLPMRDLAPEGIFGANLKLRPFIIPDLEFSQKSRRNGVVAPRDQYGNVL